MPRSHYPAQGGPQRAAWNRAEARKPRQASSAYGASSGVSALIQAKEAVERLSSGQPRPAKAPVITPLQPASPLRPSVRADNRAILSLAAILCIAAIIFALIVMKQRG